MKIDEAKDAAAGCSLLPPARLPAGAAAFAAAADRKSNT